MDGHDLIGLGPCDKDGSFNVSFVGSELRQDMFEYEETPNLQLVVSIMFDKERRAIYQQSFPNVDWTSGAVDLGDIYLNNVCLRNPENVVIP